VTQTGSQHLEDLLHHLHHLMRILRLVDGHYTARLAGNISSSTLAMSARQGRLDQWGEDHVSTSVPSGRSISPTISTLLIPVSIVGTVGVNAAGVRIPHPIFDLLGGSIDVLDLPSPQ